VELLKEETQEWAEVCPQVEQHLLSLQPLLLHLHQSLQHPMQELRLLRNLQQVVTLVLDSQQVTEPVCPALNLKLNWLEIWKKES
jgi:hypothetical protein